MTRAEKILGNLPTVSGYDNLFHRNKVAKAMKKSAWQAWLFGMDSSDLKKQKEIFETYWNAEITD